MSEKEINWSKRRLWYLIAAIALFLVGTYFYFKVQRSDVEIKTSDLEIVDSLVLSEKPITKQIGGRTVSNYIEFKCLGYSKHFEIDLYHYPCTSSQIFDLNAGDTISIKMLKADVPIINVETSRSSSNQIHSFVYKTTDFLDLDCRNKKAKDDDRFGFYLCFIMAPLTLLFALLKSKPKFIGSIEPAFILCVIGLIIMLILKNDIFK